MCVPAGIVPALICSCSQVLISSSFLLESMPGFTLAATFIEYDPSYRPMVATFCTGVRLMKLLTGIRPCEVAMRSESSASKVRWSCGRRTRMSSSSVTSSGRYEPIFTPEVTSCT